MSRTVIMKQQRDGGTVKPSQPTHTLYCSMQRVIKLADPNFLFEHIQPTPVCCYSDRLLTSI